MTIFRKIKVQIFSLVIFLILFQVVLSSVSFRSIKEVEFALEQVFTKRLPSIDNLVQADRDFQQALVAERTLLIDKLDQSIIDSQIKDYAKNKKQVFDRFLEYEKVAHSDAEKKLIESFKNKYKNWSDYSIKNLGFTNGDFSKDRIENIKLSLGEGAKLFEDSRGDMDSLQEIILQQADEEFKHALRTYENSSNKLILFLLTSLFLSGLVSYFIVNSITRKVSSTIELINNNTDQLNEISDNLSEKSNQLSTISQGQSSSVDQTSSSLHEISQMVKKNTDIAVSSAQMIDSSKLELNAGVNLIFNLAQKIKEVNNSSSLLTKSIEDNHSRLSDILKVFSQIQNKTSVINDIVFQTKLLSFNASVEAARAGEHGKGFSVVAEEIGGLAQQSGKSANEISSDLDSSYNSISNIIQLSKDEVSSAVSSNRILIDDCLKLSVECENVLKKIDSMFANISSSASEIAVASKEQNSGVEEINSAVQEISNTNQITAQRSSDVADLAQNISVISSNLDKSIEELNSLV